MSITKKIFVSAFMAAFAFMVSTVGAAYSHTGLLKMGMTNSQVMSLQQTLNSNGFLVSTTGAGSPGMETMYFGSKTDAAVKAFQASRSLSADGVVGINTGTALAALTGGSVSYPAGCTSTSGYSTTTGQPCNSQGNLPAGCTSTAGYSPTTGAACNGGGGGSNNGGSLDGTDGTINAITELTQYNDEEVGEGEEDVKIAGFEVETSNDGDVRIRSVRVEFDSTGNTGSDRLEDYVDSVSIWMGDDEVGSASADDFSESSDIYTATIQLSGAVVDSDDEVEFFIAVDGANNLDSGDIAGGADSWTVDLLSVRYEDGSGVVTTFSGSGADFTALDVPIEFVDFSTAADTELHFSTDSDSPEAGIVLVDEDAETDNVVLLKGTIEAEGDSDVNLDELPVSFSPTGVDINLIATNLILILDGEEFTENVPSIAAAATGTVTFNDLDFDISAGDTIDFEIRADINGTDDITTQGATITTNVNSTNRSHVEAENEQGDDLTDAEKTGTVTGEAQEFRSSGISLDLVSTDAESSNDTGALNDTGTFTIKFKVTAVGDDVYLATTVAAGYTYVVDDSGSATTGGVSAVVVNNTDADFDSTGNMWLIEEGETETITLTVIRTAPPSDAGLYRVSLTGVLWDITADTSPTYTYSSNMDDFKTEYVSLN